MDSEKLPLWKMAMLASPDSFGAIPANFTPELLSGKNDAIENNISQKEEKLTLYYTAIKTQFCIDEFLSFSESLATAYFRISENKDEKIFLQGNIFLAKLAKAIFEKDEKLFIENCEKYADENYFLECGKILEELSFIFEKGNGQIKEESWIDLYKAVLLLTEEYLSTKCDLPVIKVFECEENNENSSGLKIIFTPQNVNEEQLEEAALSPLKSVPCSSDFLAIGADFFDFLSKNFPCQSNEYELAEFMRKIYDEEVCENLSWLHQAIIANSLPIPDAIGVGVMEASKLGAYKNKKIYISHRIALDALRSSDASFLLLLTMLHEYGHFLDDILHERAGLEGDSEGEEGRIFADRFMEYSKSNLLNSDFKFADFITPDPEGNDQIFVLEVSNLSYEQKKGIECIFEFSEDLENGNLKLPSGTEVEDAEFFGFVNLTNAASKTHQNLTIAGAKTEKVTVNNLLTDGSIWPDFPTETYLETSIPFTLITLGREKVTRDRQIIYESHLGKNQHWHSMCPKLGNSPTNAEVINLILKQAEEWYSEAIKKKKENKDDESLFALGKLCHMAQDSFVMAHCWRRYTGDEKFVTISRIDKEEHGKIWTFQDYEKQDGSLHAFADAPKQGDLYQNIQTIGYKSALNATTEIMARYARNMEWHERYSALIPLKDYMSKIYELCKGREKELSGGSHPWFKKEDPLNKTKVQEFLTKLSMAVDI